MNVSENPGPPGTDATITVKPSTEQVGVMVGRYKLLERIGEGGFSTIRTATVRGCRNTGA